MTDYNDGKWHFWNGGECPVHPESVVDVVWPSFMDDQRAFREERKANEFSWNVERHIPPMMFRVTKPYRGPETYTGECFAGQALASLAGSVTSDGSDFLHSAGVQSAALWAYTFADAMIAARLAGANLKENPAMNARFEDDGYESV